MAVSDTPWSKFSPADYSVEQWHRACIAHDHEGAPSSKEQCKLPVREPNGTLNRAGVHAAQAALSGARGGIKLSVSQRIAATKTLAGYYKQLGEKPPAPKKPAFLKHKEEPVDTFLAHYGVKGMKWKDRNAKSDFAQPNKNPTQPSKFNNSGFNPKPGQVKHDSSAPKGDVDWAKKSATSASLQKIADKSHSQFQDRFRELMKDPRFKDVADLIKARIANPGAAQNPKVKAFFKQASKIHDDIWAKNSKEVFGDPPSKKFSLVAVRHPDGSVTSELVKTAAAGAHLAQPTSNKKKVKKLKGSGPRQFVHNEAVDDFLAHFGIKGMRWGFRRERGSDGTVSGAIKEGHVEGHETGNHGGGSSSSGGKEHLSADAERLLKTSQKKPHEMSNDEIKAANARADAIKKYNELFGPRDPNKELADAVARLRLEKDYAALKAELHPSALKRVSNLIKLTAPAFGAVHDLVNSKTGKKVTKHLTDALAEAFNAPAPPKRTRATAGRPVRPKKQKRPKGAPTSGATRVTAEHVSTHTTPVYNVTTLGSAVSPSALQRRS